MPALVLSGLAKRYGEVTALDGLDLEVPRGSLFGFLGGNGAGKSTTMKLMLGLARPTAGGGRVLGHDIVEESLAIRCKVGYLAQEPRFYDYMTARETLEFVARFYPALRGRSGARVGEALDAVGLSSKADRPVGGFSGGERQRLGIAQAWLHGPELLILDEPAASLDPLGREDVLQVLTSLCERTTVFYSTHILDDVQRVSDRVAIIDRGRLVAQAPVEELLMAGEGSVYSLRLRGAGRELLARIDALPWVAGVTTRTLTDSDSWSVAVSDEAAAERELLRLVLAASEVQVLEFRRWARELEDVFIELVGSGRESTGSREAGHVA